MRLTIAFVTNRKEPMLNWFAQSFEKQAKESPIFPYVIIISPYIVSECPLYQSSPPKPCVWSGPHRLTSRDYFSAANARNTALCMAQDGYLAYVDDLSVLAPTWLSSVIEAMSFNGITLGAYQKVNKLVVENGEIKSFENQPGSAGRDSRWGFGRDNRAVDVPGDLLYGCSLVAPVEAYLKVGGWPEICGGLGFEDVVMGQAMQNAGVPFRYDRRMMTYESEEHHQLEPAWEKYNPKLKGARDDDDKAWRVLKMVKGGMKYFENYYEGGMRKMRDEVLSGNPFPILNNPQHCWYSATPLSEL